MNTLLNEPFFIENLAIGLSLYRSPPKETI